MRNKPVMPLRELLSDSVKLSPGEQDILVRGLSLDSRKVAPGDAFFALQGTRQHGITFAPMALAQGASVVLAEAPAPATSAAVPALWIDHLSDQLGLIADRFFGQPSQALRMIGVTGTNGKTSTVQLLAQALSNAGYRAATIGTLGSGIHGALKTADRTTPDAISVHALLADFRDEGASHVAMEVSSHALQQGRVNGVQFDIAVFTNLTRDHLDYHASMQEYAAAKAKLFHWPNLSTAVINIDDEFGRALLRNLSSTVQVLSFGIEAENCDLKAKNIQQSSSGLTFDLITPWGSGVVHTSLLGRFNVANLLGVAGCLGTLGFDFSQIKAAIAKMEPVPGRMNRLGGEVGLPLVVIDYAHTPDALEQVLSSLRLHSGQGRLICVFGCGGERDNGKRPEMAAIAERLSNIAIVTDDNPRHEDGDKIVEQILAGFRYPQRVIIERDRKAAIARAISLAGAEDIVVIAGKGHEAYQETAGRRIPFDDLLVARNALEAHA